MKIGPNTKQALVLIGLFILLMAIVLPLGFLCSWLDHHVGVGAALGVLGATFLLGLLGIGILMDRLEGP